MYVFFVSAVSLCFSAYANVSASARVSVLICREFQLTKQLVYIHRRSKDLEFKDACEVMRNAGVEYTILKYGDIISMEEAKFPYRVVRGALELPNPETAVGEEHYMFDTFPLPTLFLSSYLYSLLYYRH